MLWRCLVQLVLLFPARAVVVDRIAVVVGRVPILDSDIDRDVRITAFLNQEGVDLGLAFRKQAANRLIDQELIRQQIRLGGFPVASQSETDRLVKSIEEERFSSSAQLIHALTEYGVTAPELRDRLSWELTVLRFIDTMFRPQVVISDAEIQHYYDSHAAQFRAQPLAAVRPAITETITGERVNELLNDWLDQSRKTTRVVYLDKSLA